MKPVKAFVCLLGLGVLPAFAQGSSQQPPRVPQLPKLQEQKAIVRPVLTYTPRESDVYCAGFVADKAPVSDLFVLAGEEGGLKQEYSDRDVVYLKGNATEGSEYLLLRRIIDPVMKVPLFDGQIKMLKEMGTVYAEIGRVKVMRVQDTTVTAHVKFACMEIQAGDIAVPMQEKPKPTAPAGTYDRYALPSGQNYGIIVTGKEFDSTMGAGKTVYLNIGEQKGVTVGQTYRIFRTYLSAASDPNRRYLDKTPMILNGMRTGYVLTPAQRAVLPRDVLGEMVIISVSGKSATALITMSGAEIFPGDEVELKP